VKFSVFQQFDNSGDVWTPQHSNFIHAHLQCAEFSSSDRRLKIDWTPYVDRNL